MGTRNYQEVIDALNSDEYTTESIINRMRGFLMNPASKVEGSFAMDNLQAVGQEIARAVNMRIIDFIDLVMLDTAAYEFLDRKGLDYGLERNPATASVGYVLFDGEAGTVIPKGTTLLSEANTFVTDYEAVIPQSGNIQIKATCTSLGTAGNILAGAITGIRSTESINGVSVSNPEAFEGGTEEEQDESYRNRIYEKIRMPIASGNANSYVYWAKQVSGVGNARCIPLWDGAGTVKVVILSADGTAPDDTIIENVAKYIETQRPIGAKVTVSKAEEKQVRIEGSIKLTSGYKLIDVQTTADRIIREYMTGIAYEEENKTLSYFKISDLIFNVEGVADVIDYTVNGKKNSISAGASEFFSLQEIVLHEN